MLQVHGSSLDGSSNDRCWFIFYYSVAQTVMLSILQIHSFSLPLIQHRVMEIPFFFYFYFFTSTVYGSINKCPAFSWSVGKWEVSGLWVGQIHFIQFAIWKSDFSKPNSVRSLQCGDAILQSKNKNSFILVCRFKGFMLFSVLLRVNYHMTYTHF